MPITIHAHGVVRRHAAGKAVAVGGGVNGVA